MITKKLVSDGYKKWLSELKIYILPWKHNLGFLLCRTYNKIFVRYVLGDSSKLIGITEFQGVLEVQLSSIKRIEETLQKNKDIAVKRTLP